MLMFLLHKKLIKICFKNHVDLLLWCSTAHEVQLACFTVYDDNDRKIEKNVCIANWSFVPKQAEVIFRIENKKMFSEIVC